MFHESLPPWVGRTYAQISMVYMILPVAILYFAPDAIIVTLIATLVAIISMRLVYEILFRHKRRDAVRRAVLAFGQSPLCVECGYSLEGIDVASCPECGFDNAGFRASLRRGESG